MPRSGASAEAAVKEIRNLKEEGDCSVLLGKIIPRFPPEGD